MIGAPLGRREPNPRCIPRSRFCCRVELIDGLRRNETERSVPWRSMASSVNFRPIGVVDLDRIERINAANVPEVGAAERDHLAFLVEECSLAIAAESNGEVVGFCLVLGPGSSYDSVNYRWFAERHPDSLYLDRVAFDVSVRGRGFGTALYDHVDRIMRSDFVDADGLALEVNVDPPNEPSLRFHDKLGFREVGRQMSHGIEVSLMHRPISDRS